MKIPRGDAQSELAPAWLPIVDTQGHPVKPIIRCRCGRWMSIGNHHVHADGRVTASFYHAEDMDWADATR